MAILTTKRLSVNHLCASDAAFMLKLINQASWKKFIGDRKIETIEQAKKYILDVYAPYYSRLGFGLYRVDTLTDNRPIGICGLLKRETLADVDLGFAFLDDYGNQGYAHEVSRAVLDYECSKHGFQRVVAITVQNNAKSIKLLIKLGFSFEKNITLPGDEKSLMLFGFCPPAMTAPK